MTDPKKFRPVGFNLGGWLSQALLSKGHEGPFITRKDFQDIAGWGFNSVRLPVDGPWLFEDEGKGRLAPERLGIVKEALGWARDAGLLTILDLHQSPWHSFAKPELENLWKSGEDLGLFCRSVAELAGALKGLDAPLWFDVLNEPTARAAVDWNRAAPAIVRAVRETDPDRVVVLESALWASVTTVEELAAAVRDPNLVYSVHFYLPMFVTHQRAPWWKEGEPYRETVHYPGRLPRAAEYLAGELPPMTRWFLELEDRAWDREALRELLAPVKRLMDRGETVYCGEFGVFEEAPRETRLNWTRDVVRLFSELGVGWSYWNYKWLDFGIRPGSPREGSKPLDEGMLEVLRAGI